MTRYRNRTIADLRDIGRDWRQSIIRAAGLDPDGKLVPLPPRRPRPQDIFAANADMPANDRDAALRRSLNWTWR